MEDCNGYGVASGLKASFGFAQLAGPTARAATQELCETFLVFSRLYFDVPNTIAVIADRAIGRELAHAGGIQDGHSRPSLLIAIRCGSFILTVDIGLIIREQQIRIVLQ